MGFNTLNLGAPCVFFAFKGGFAESALSFRELLAPHCPSGGARSHMDGGGRDLMPRSGFSPEFSMYPTPLNPFQRNNPHPKWVKTRADPFKT